MNIPAWPTVQQTKAEIERIRSEPDQKKRMAALFDFLTGEGFQASRFARTVVAILQEQDRRIAELENK